MIWFTKVELRGSFSLFSHKIDLNQHTFVLVLIPNYIMTGQGIT